VVLASVLIGLRIYDVIGAIFAIPVAAVISTFFFYYLNRNVGAQGDVASRAARRIEEREHRPVRVPTAPAVTGSAATEISPSGARGSKRRSIGRQPTIVPAPPPDAPA
jgi:hypothetical protein